MISLSYILLLMYKLDINQIFVLNKKIENYYFEISL